MAKPVKCNIMSLNKAYYGTTNGTLLRALPNSNKLFFDGTECNPTTTFLKIKKRKSCTFQMNKDGFSCFVCELNNTLSLKREKDSSSIFKICNIKGYPNSMKLIKTKRGYYVTCDGNGRIITKMINTSDPLMEAIFSIEPANDAVDGNPAGLMLPSSFDANNNTVQDSCGRDDCPNLIMETAI